MKKYLLLMFVLLAVPGYAQNRCTTLSPISATGRTQISVSGGTDLSRFNGGQFSYRTTGTPASVSLTIEAGNVPAATQTPFEKIAAVTNTTGADMGSATGVYRFWWVNVGTLSGGTTPTIIVEACMTPVTLTAELTGEAIGEALGLTEGSVPVAGSGGVLEDSQITDDGTTTTFAGDVNLSGIEDGQLLIKDGGVIRGTAGLGSTDEVNRTTAGCGVAYSGSGLSFLVSACTYVIGGQQYTSAQTTVTLDAADATNPRFDIIVVNDSGLATKVTGTAAADPAIPSADPTSQLVIAGGILVNANATTPANIFTEDIYLENTEWTCAASDASHVCDSATDPFAGTVSVEATTAARNDNVSFTRSTSVILGNYNNLVCHIQSKATWANNRSLTLTFELANETKGSGVVLSNGAFGFDSSNTSSYQQIVVPVSQFGYSGSVDEFKVTVTGGGGAQTIGYFLDNCQLQTGLQAPQTVTGISPIEVSEAGVISCPTCLTTSSSIDLSVVGGIVGGSLVDGSAMSPFALASTGRRFPTPYDLYLSGPTLCGDATTNTGWLSAYFVRNAPVDNSQAATSTGQRVHTTLRGGLDGCTTQTLEPLFPFAAGTNLGGQAGGSNVTGTGPTYWSTSIYGDNIQPLGAGHIAATVGTGATVYTGMGRNAFETSDEETVLIPVPPLTVKAMCIVMTSNNGAGGSFDVTVRKDQVATAATLNIPASLGLGLTCSDPDEFSVAFALGDLFSISVVNNNGAAATGTITTIVVYVEMTLPYTGMLVWPRISNAHQLFGSSTHYVSPWASTTVGTTELAKAFGASRPGTLKTLQCFIKTDPTSGDTVWTVRKNGEDTAITLTVTTSTGDDTVVSDLTNTNAVTSANDYLALEYVSGAGPEFWSGCTLGVQ